MTMSDDKRSFTQKLRDENGIIGNDDKTTNTSTKIKDDLKDTKDHINSDFQKKEEDIKADIKKEEAKNKQVKTDIENQKIDESTSYVILAAIIIIIIIIILLCFL